MKSLLTLVTLLFCCTLVGCASSEDKANAKRMAEMAVEQAKLVVKDCGASITALEGWYKKNKVEVDKLSAWWRTKSGSEKDSLMSAHKPLRSTAFRAKIQMTIRCGFAPWNSRRRPSDPR